MKNFKQPSLADRRDTAAKARQAERERALAKVAANAPKLAEQQEARRATNEAREARAAQRKIEKQEAAARAARALEAEQAARKAAEEAEREAQARAQVENAAREVELKARQKAERDARYAARKARKK